MGNVFSNSSNYQGKLKEVTEIGAEYMGDASVKADAEMIEMTVELLLAAGLDSFQVCIGNAGYFKGICEEAGIDETAELELRDMISNKNYFGADDILSDLSIPEKQRKAVLRCTELFGNADILENALDGVSEKRSIDAILRLKELYAEICKYHIEKYVTFDLGMLSKYNYYTGIVFRAFISELGEPVVKGGRYDNLIDEYCTGKPAVGFAINVDLYIKVMEEKIDEVLKVTNLYNK